MNLTTLSARDLAIIMAGATIVVGVIIAAVAKWLLFRRKRRTGSLQS
jgi:hypothetical protein